MLLMFYISSIITVFLEIYCSVLTVDEETIFVQSWHQTGTKKKLQLLRVWSYYIFQTRCLLEKALPEPSLRYLSKAYALYLSVNAI